MTRDTPGLVKPIIARQTHEQAYNVLNTDIVRSVPHPHTQQAGHTHLYMLHYSAIWFKSDKLIHLPLLNAQINTTYFCVFEFVHVCLFDVDLTEVD